MKIVIVGFMAFFLFSTVSPVFAQKPTKEERKARRDSIKADKIAKGKLMITPLAGPGYTPELGGLIAATTMISFKTSGEDSLVQRSSLPTAIGITTTGAYFFSSILTSYWLQDKLRINADLWFKDMPDNYWGVGYEAGKNYPKGDSTTAYNRTWVWFNPRFLWQFRKHNFIGLNLDLNYTKASDVSPGMQSDSYYQKFGNENFNSGVGLIYQYDSRDIPVNAWKGFYANLSATFYGSFLGGKNNYQVYQLDARKYFNLFSRKGSTLATQLKFRASTGDVPYGELSQPGTPFDLRGYTWGQYRDKDMLFAIAEYRYMFMKKNGNLSKSGVVGWVGAGTLGETVSTFTGILPDFGIGYRFEVQPRMNLRIDFGWGVETFGFYFNFNEAF
jgi:outer membrane protein assembly factor BamA